MKFTEISKFLNHPAVYKCALVNPFDTGIKYLMPELNPRPPWLFKGLTARHIYIYIYICRSAAKG